MKLFRLFLLLSGLPLCTLTARAAALDSDGDGMPDAWEITYGLNPNNAADAFLDLDADGMTNLQEYLADTDPTNPLSYLRMDSITCAGGQTSLQFASRP